MSDETGPVAQKDVVSMLEARGRLFKDWCDLVDEGLEPKKARAALKTADGRSELFELATKSYDEMLGRDLMEDVKLLETPRLDEVPDVNLFNLKIAWWMSSVLLPASRAPRPRRLGIELVSVHPQASVPEASKSLALESFCRHLLVSADTVPFSAQRQVTFLSRFHDDAYFEPKQGGDEAVEAASHIVWLANVVERRGAPADKLLAKEVKKESPKSHFVLDLLLHPCWLEQPTNKPFDSSAYQDEF